MQVPSPTQHSEFRIQHCRSCSVVCSPGLDLIPGPGTPYAARQPKKKKIIITPDSVSKEVHTRELSPLELGCAQKRGPHHVHLCRGDQPGTSPGRLPGWGGMSSAPGKAVQPLRHRSARGPARPEANGAPHELILHPPFSSLQPAGRAVALPLLRNINSGFPKRHGKKVPQCH